MTILLCHDIHIDAITRNEYACDAGNLCEKWDTRWAIVTVLKDTV